MKKLFSLVVALFMLMTAFNALAAEVGVIVIGGEETATTPVSLDDIQLEQVAEMPDYAKLTPMAFNFSDKLIYYYWSNGGNVYESGSYSSGTSASYAALQIALLNLKTKEIDYNEEIKNITFTFDEKYQYGGWLYQLDPDAGFRVIGKNGEKYAIKPMYEGYFLVGGALPNAIVDGKEPLSLTFNIGDNEITYNIRK